MDRYGTLEKFSYGDANQSQKEKEKEKLIIFNTMGKIFII